MAYQYPAVEGLTLTREHNGQAGAYVELTWRPYENVNIGSYEVFTSEDDGHTWTEVDTIDHDTAGANWNGEEGVFELSVFTGNPGDIFRVVATAVAGPGAWDSEPAFVVWPEELALTTIWGRVLAPSSESLTMQQRIVLVETLAAGGPEFNTRIFADASGYWFIRLRSNVRIRITELGTSLVRECYVPVDNTKAHHILSLRNVGMREQGWQ